jgi:nicotinamidase-related amidase
VKDVVLIVDVFDDFRHDDGETLRASFLERLPQLTGLVDEARTGSIPVVFANDRHGQWHGDLQRFLRETEVEAGRLRPGAGDAFFFKDHYSAFGHTALEVLLRELEAERLVLAGMTLEGCVTQTAIDARERGFKVTVVEPACPRIDDEAAEVAVEYLRRIVGAWVETGAPFATVSRSS